MRTLPLKVSLSMTSESSAPGTHATTRLTSSRKANTRSGGAPTVKEFSICISALCACVRILAGAGLSADTRWEMGELVASLDEWAAHDPHLAIATVVGTAGSTPRPTGARLLVDVDGRMAGSVSGGCLEAAVIGEAQATLAGKAPPRLLHYGISDEMGWEVGLACGGSVDIFVESLRWDGSDRVLTAVRDAVGSDRAVALLTVVSGDPAGARAAVRDDGSRVGS